MGPGRGGGGAAAAPSSGSFLPGAALCAQETELNLALASGGAAFLLHHPVSRFFLEEKDREDEGEGHGGREDAARRTERAAWLVLWLGTRLT